SLLRPNWRCRGLVVSIMPIRRCLKPWLRRLDLERSLGLPQSLHTDALRTGFSDQLTANDRAIAQGLSKEGDRLINGARLELFCSKSANLVFAVVPWTLARCQDFAIGEVLSVNFTPLMRCSDGCLSQAILVKGLSSRQPAWDDRPELWFGGLLTPQFD